VIKPEKMKASPDKQLPLIPENRKVEEIMSKRSLRERFAQILPHELQLPISFDHQELIKRMSFIDNSI
jgi:hypothetical protein